MLGWGLSPYFRFYLTACNRAIFNICIREKSIPICKVTRRLDWNHGAVHRKINNAVLSYQPIIWESGTRSSCQSDVEWLHIRYGSVVTPQADIVGESIGDVLSHKVDIWPISWYGQVAWSCKTCSSTIIGVIKCTTCEWTLSGLCIWENSFRHKGDLLWSPCARKILVSYCSCRLGSGWWAICKRNIKCISRCLFSSSSHWASNLNVFWVISCDISIRF